MFANRELENIHESRLNPEYLELSEYEISNLIETWVYLNHHSEHKVKYDGAIVTCETCEVWEDMYEFYLDGGWK